jgi:nucleoside-diphosphate-sugar epimerase
VSRVLVTGASGFVGHNALAPLAALGLEVHALSSREQPGGAPVAAWHRADLLERGAGEELVHRVAPEHLLHFAWYAEPGKYWTSPENVRWVEASLALLRAFHAEGGRRAVVAGTCAEYDWNHGFLSEGVTPLRPATLYGRSKNSLREVAEAFAAEAGLGLAWGRIFFLYGPREHPGRLVSSVARALVAGEEAPTSEGSQVRDFLHVEDVAGAFCALLLADVTGPVNIGSGVPVTVRQVVEEVARAAGRPELVRAGALPQRENEPPLIVADVRRLHDEVGFTPRHPLEEGIEQTVAWWRERT